MDLGLQRPLEVPLLFFMRVVDGFRFFHYVESGLKEVFS